MNDSPPSYAEAIAQPPGVKEQPDELDASLDALPTGFAKDIFALVDVSGSMEGGKLTRAKRAIRKLQRRALVVDRFGIASFNSQVASVMPLTPCDQEISISGYVDPLRAGGGTALYDAVVWGLKTLHELRTGSDHPKNAQLVVLTDGEDTSSSKRLSAAREAIEAARPDIEVVVVAVGSRGDGTLRELTQGIAELIAEKEDNSVAVDQSLRRVRDRDSARVSAAQARFQVQSRYRRDTCRSRSRSRSRSPPLEARIGDATAPSRSPSPPRSPSPFSRHSVSPPRRRRASFRSPSRSPSRSPGRSPSPPSRMDVGVSVTPSRSRGRSRGRSRSRSRSRSGSRRRRDRS
jgi:uncharacterized protein YegL